MRRNDAKNAYVKLKAASYFNLTFETYGKKLIVGRLR